MPQTVEIDDDVYRFIESRAQGFGQSISTTLRRLLTITGHSGVPNAAPSTLTAAAAGASPVILLATDPVFLQRSVTDRYLGMLGLVHDEHPGSFEKVLQVSGRSRAYFAQSREDIEKSGVHTQPRPISSSGYWAMTNTDSRKKAELIRRVLRVIGYTAEDIRAAEAALKS